MKWSLWRAAELVRDRYFTVDARSLGLFRIYFGLSLIANLYDRTQGGDAIAFYTNLGVMPNHYALFAPLGDHVWSLLFAFSTTAEIQVAFILIVLVYLAFTVGYCTKLAQILVIVSLLSLDNRNLALQNGGVVVTNLVAIWSVFLPLGARFSIDHLLRSTSERREASPSERGRREAPIRSEPRYARLAFFGMLLNFSCIYIFNFAHKTGLTWRDGSAVHWVLWQNRIATIWAAWLRMHEPRWLSPALTWSTLVLEALLPLWLLSPIFTKWTRRIAIFSMVTLHAGISFMMTLGPFSYSMMAFAFLLIGPDDWTIARRLFWHRGPKVLVVYEAASGRHSRCARLLARLDAREALEFANRGDADRLPMGAPSDASSVPLLMYDPRDGSWFRGAAALARLVRELPFGALYAWPLELPGLRDVVGVALDRSHPPLAESFRLRPESPAARFARGFRRVCGEMAAAVLLTTVLIQMSVDNWALPQRFRVREEPRLVREIVGYLRIPQGWSMFSPEAPREDGTLVVDALLSDGRHLDPRKQAPPDFEAARHGPWFDDQQWCDWDLRMKFEGNRHLHPYFRDYIARLDHLRSWRQNAGIVRFDVYWVNNAAPPPGSREPYDMRRQFRFLAERLERRKRRDREV